eukprot:PITA_22429
MPRPEGPMKTKTLISCMLLILTLSTSLHLSVAQNTVSDPPDWYVCGNTEYINGEDFHHNLIHVLESLVGNASTTGFNATVQGKNDNRTSVYGFVQCRGDLNSSDCKDCAFTAKEYLLWECNSTSGFINRSARCFLRYDNHIFYNDYDESSEFTKICNPNAASIISDRDLLANSTVEALLKIIEKTVRSRTLFGTDKYGTRDTNFPDMYCLAQCWNHMSPKNCQSCLTAGRLNISSGGCQTGGLGGDYLSVYCILRYEMYSFIDTSSMPAPPPPPLPSPPLPSPPLPRESPPLSEHKVSNVVGITVGVVAATVGLITVIGLWKWNFFSRLKHWKRISRARGDGGEIDLSPSIANPELIFKHNILKEAASNFNEENKLGEGGFGSVFKGVLPDGREVAIKRLNINSRQGDTEFLNEVNLISRVQHKNLVKLLGCFVKGPERLLVYEYLQNGSLDKILFDSTKRHLLDWSGRYEIIVGIARGLAYLHEESQIRIIHRDIKASNILLDNKYRPKIADFGLAKLFGEDQSHVSTRIAGTCGYMAPEYALRGQLTEKADVFGFGVVVLEMVSGRKNQSLPQHTEFLLEETWRMYNEERTLDVMDPTLEDTYSSEQLIRMIKIGLLCTQGAASLRPSMSRVVSMLTSEREHLPLPTRPIFMDVDSLVTAHQIERLRFIDPPTHADIHSAAADPSSDTLEPR